MSKGYSFHNGKFISRITINGRKYYLGTWDDERLAHSIYIIASHCFDLAQHYLKQKRECIRKNKKQLSLFDYNLISGDLIDEEIINKAIELLKK